MHRHLDDICWMKDTLITWTKDEIGKGKDCVPTHELGLVVDMIKDLYKAEEECWEALYYKSVVEAMEEQSWDDGHEYRRGYEPSQYRDMGPRSNAMLMREHMDKDLRTINRDYQHMDEDVAKKMKAYDEYKYARKHYHDQHDMSSKQMMDKKASEHLDNMMDMVKDIWEDADPEMRKKIKMEIESITKMMA